MFQSKFTSLSLAFKTDKITLEKRLEIQERSRDIAEENVAKELKGLREAWEVSSRPNEKGWNYVLCCAVWLDVICLYSIWLHILFGIQLLMVLYKQKIYQGNTKIRNTGN